MANFLITEQINNNDPFLTEQDQPVQILKVNNIYRIEVLEVWSHTQHPIQVSWVESSPGPRQGMRSSTHNTQGHPWEIGNTPRGCFAFSQWDTTPLHLGRERDIGASFFLLLDAEHRVCNEGQSGIAGVGGHNAGQGYGEAGGQRGQVGAGARHQGDCGERDFTAVVYSLLQPSSLTTTAFKNTLWDTFQC